MRKHFLHKNIFSLLFIAGCVFIYSCENDVNEVRDLGRKTLNAEEGKDINSYLSMNGKMRAHLTAPLLLRSLTDTGMRAEFPHSLHVDFYNDSTKIESQLSARFGEYMEGTGKVFLKDSVVAFNIKGDSLFCKELHWDQNAQKFYTNKQVIVSKAFRKDYFIGLDGMTCNQDLTDIHLFKIIPGSFAVVPDSLAAGSK